MPVLILLTVLFAAVGVSVFLVLMLMLIIGLNGMSGAAAQPWLIGAALILFVVPNLGAGCLLSLISPEEATTFPMPTKASSGGSAVRFSRTRGSR